jgi:mannose-6-phosphate isomerase
MWYIADADPGAELFVGLKQGITREAFERAIADGTVDRCVHRLAVRAGDAMFIPSGRVHAIGAGLAIFEIQQNSDTTFRVHDWNRVGLDGKPRELHIPQSLASIDFDDVEPPLLDVQTVRDGSFSEQTLVNHPLFHVDLMEAVDEGEFRPDVPWLRVLACVGGTLAVSGGGRLDRLRAGDFCLLPAGVADIVIQGEAGARFLLVEAGR